ncbi:MAG: hypothetical protein AB7O31_16355 [Burkholderiales bacterium]
MQEGELGRSIRLNGMAYAPTNEQGVVYLFGRLAPKIGFHVESVQVRFPDCIAVRRGKRCRIEFEYWASTYRTHRHPPKGADIIVCWDNDWEHRPPQYKHLEIIELKRYVGALPRIFAVGCDENVRGHVVDKNYVLGWSLPRKAQVGDLILMYRSRPASEIRDLWAVRGPFYEEKKWGFGGEIRRLARLDNPLTYKDMKADFNARSMAVVRKQFMGKTDVTDDWPILHSMIVARNPWVGKVLRPYRID